MQLKCKINNVVYDKNLIQGITFSEEYNETLDSASIIIDQVTQIKDIKPYDDVYIYDADFDFNGFNEKGELILINNTKPKFYKHFLIDQINEEILILNTNELNDNGENKNLYKYKINLFSETKGLETIQLPNISITQPLNPKKKISIYQYMEKYINLYSPKIKVAKNKEQWEYENKYKLDDSLEFKKIFDSCYTPDFTLNSPNLRDVLSKLMITKDMIPYVENNIIKGLDITARNGKFNLDVGEVGYIYGSLSSANYADNLKTNYINALSQDRTCRMVEYLGFRNSSTPLMKISDLRVETSFPIYKINKVLLCYYKKCQILTSNKKSDGTFETTREQKAFLCKQDITKLVKLNSERNLLSKDFNELENSSSIDTIDEMAKYRPCTVGYDIGSKYITGWGEKYSYIKNDITWWNYERTYVENIVERLDKMNSFGTYTYGYIAKDLKENQSLVVGDKLFSDILPDTEGDNSKLSKGSLISPFTNVSSALKGFFFQIEYDGFYNGAVITTKDGASSDIVLNDNQSNSLPLLEQDGLAQKEKINRFGNKAYTISVRYKKYEDIQKLGSYLPKDDVVIYHKEYSINANVINCTYYGIKDYVLKNYFTSVYAKHRPYNLMSYEESITRAENKKNIFYLSKDKQYYENKDFSIQTNKIEGNFFEKLFSCFKSLEQEDIPSIEYIKQKDKINYGYLNLKGNIYDKSGNIISEQKFNNYASDINAFVNGNSLCFNIKMYDNVSMGVYISKHEPFESRNDYLWDTLVNPENSISGSQQNWYMTVDDIETGFVENMGFYVCHLDQNKFFSDELTPFKEVEDYTGEAKEALETYYKNIFKLPLIDLKDDNYEEKNVIGNNFLINKDNKEIIDMTYQFEPISSDDNILFSPLFLKLSDFYGNYNKFENELKIEDKKILDSKTWHEGELTNEIFNNYVYNLPGANRPDQEPDIMYPVNFWRIALTIDKDIVENKKPLKPISFPITIKGEDYRENGAFGNPIGNGYRDIVYYYEMIVDNIEIGYPPSPSQKPMIYLTGSQIVKMKDYSGYGSVKEEQFLERNTIVLNQITPDEYKYNQAEEGKVLFSNVVQKSAKDKAIHEPYFENEFDIKFNGNSNKIDSLNCGIYEFYPEAQTIIFAEEITIQNATYAQNMFVVGEKENLKKSLVYNEYDYDDEEFSKKILKTKKVSDVFKVKDNYILIDLNNVDDEIKSLQFWYLDGVELNNYYQSHFDKASYKFVFGVNLTDKDYENGEVKIYISQLSSLNKKVYDENYNLIGEIENYNQAEKIEENLKITSTVKNDNLKTIFPSWYYENALKYKNVKIENDALNCTATLTIPSIGGTSIGTETINSTYKIQVGSGTISLKFDNARMPVESIDLSFDEEENAYVSNIDMSKFDSKIVSLYWDETEIIFSNDHIYGTGQHYKKY